MSTIFAHSGESIDNGFGDHMMDAGHWANDGGFTVLWMLLMMVIIVGGAVYLFTHIGRDTSQAKDKDPLKIAKSRYAKGEIDKKQYEDIKKDIS